MMLYPSIMELMKKAGNRYSLVIAASKRARNILSEEASEESGNLDGARSITRAVCEIAEDKVLVVNETREQELEREAEYEAKVQAVEAAENAEAIKAAEETDAPDAE